MTIIILTIAAAIAASIGAWLLRRRPRIPRISLEDRLRSYQVTRPIHR